MIAETNTSPARERQARLQERYAEVRGHSRRICATLEPEDCVIQSMADVSPIRWHLAHTTWFFETFVLKSLDGYTPVSDDFEYLFNSYYNTVGEPFPRHRRGLLSRPTVQQVWDYRAVVDKQVCEHLASPDLPGELLDVVELGLHHEQQHQELMLTDIKHVLSCNPLYPAHVAEEPVCEAAADLDWIDHPGGLIAVGHEDGGFKFDNELPRHRVYMKAFALAQRLVTNGEYLAFIEDDGYLRPDVWLSLGWSHVQEQGWTAPLYWLERGRDRLEFTLGGLRTLDLSQPVTHVSYFEADAFARWAGARLPTEAEWETAAEKEPSVARCSEDFFDQEAPVQPTHEGTNDGFDSLFGSTWQWTSSAYAPYPGYKVPHGALGEYNGKFMCNQYVLRGSSCATSRGHHRLTYRNFFPPDARWQFSGIRLAHD